MTDQMSCDSISILETLRPGDLKTGSDLADMLTYGGYGISVTLRQPTTGKMFIDELRTIASKARGGHHSPIVHIEAHGSPQGIQVGAGDRLSWEDLRDALTEINIASRLNLVVVLAACAGANLAKVIWPHQRAAVWAAIGPVRDLTADEIGHDFKGFYHELLSSLDGRRALEVLNGAVVGSEWKYGFYPAQFFFRYAFHHYLRGEANPAKLREREDLLVNQIVRNRPEPPGLRKRVRLNLQNHGSHFSTRRRHFFMIDLYPENEQRFQVTLADCERHPAEDPD